MLKMKAQCENCKARTESQGEAYICSYECTFCKKCTDDMNAICLKCDGELLMRPRRLKNPVEVVISQVKSKLRGK